ncbi:hypothetical protein F4802DRAFT_377303 [Xylaria palmicola]|nr:hypothetical protein F4802DRAFT_377303 [Xylaria palmicola]
MYVPEGQLYPTHMPPSLATEGLGKRSSIPSIEEEKKDASEELCSPQMCYPGHSGVSVRPSCPWPGGRGVPHHAMPGRMRAGTQGTAGHGRAREWRQGDGAGQRLTGARGESGGQRVSLLLFFASRREVSEWPGLLSIGEPGGPSTRVEYDITRQSLWFPANPLQVVVRCTNKRYTLYTHPCNYSVLTISFVPNTGRHRR